MEDDKTRRAQWNLVAVILAVTFAIMWYLITVAKHLEQTSALFIGIPAAIAIMVALAPRAKTVTGAILKALTIGLLISGVLLREGFICILMAAPIFYVVGIIVGLSIDFARKKRATMTCLLLFAFVPMSFEGTSQRWSFAREESVTVERVVAASSAEVEAALAQSPRVDGRLPLYLRLRFPRPVSARGAGLQTGDFRAIHFAGGEGRPGDLVMQVAESEPGHIRFVALSDNSKIAHWLTWRSSEVRWNAIDAGHTRVAWTLNFRRDLDPAWYFHPWERYAVGLAAEYLIENNAAPQR